MSLLEIIRNGVNRTYGTPPNITYNTIPMDFSRYNYSSRYGDCKTSSGRTPSYQAINDYDIDNCTSLCNIDDNCSGFSFDDNTKKCIIFTPSIGKTIDSNVDIYNSPVYTASVGTNVNNMCYIKKNNIPDGYRLLNNGMCAPDWGYTTRNYSSATFKDCYTSCKLDQQCQGFSYSNNGICAIHSPRFVQNGQLHSSVTNEDLDWQWKTIDNDPGITSGDPYNSISYWNLGTNNGPLTRIYSVDNNWNCYIKSDLEKRKTVTNNTANYTSLPGLCRAKDGKVPVHTDNFFGFEFNGVSNKYGETEELCKTTCNNDPLCSGYSWLKNIPSNNLIWYNGVRYNRCQLYNYTFSNVKGTLDVPSAIPWNYSEARFSPVYTSNNNPDWDCKIKTRDELPNYKPAITGICKTANNKDIPYKSGKTTYNNCINLCEKDIKCTGYSYGNDGMCYIHNPTAPTNPYDINNINMEPDTTPLTQGSNNTQYNCYIKRYGKCFEIMSLNSEFQNPPVDSTNKSNIIDNWVGGVLNNSTGTTGVTKLYNIQRAFLDSNTYIEQIIPNIKLEGNAYMFNIYGYYDGKTDNILELEILMSTLENNNETNIVLESTRGVIYAQQSFNRSIRLEAKDVNQWIQVNIKINIKNKSPDRIYINKAEFVKEYFCPVNITPTAPVTTGVPTTTNVPTTTKITLPPNNISRIINTNMIDSNSVQIVLSNNITMEQNSDIINAIEKMINQDNLYVLSYNYDSLSNTYIIYVNNSVTPNTEQFVVFPQGLTIKVIFQTPDINNSINNLMNLSENNIRSIILPTTTSITSTSVSTNTNSTNTNSASTSTSINSADANIYEGTTINSTTSNNNNNIKIIVGIVVGVIVLLIIAIIIYFKFIRKTINNE